VQAHLEDQQPQFPETFSGNLSEPLAVFVSIHHGPRLRGCIGTIDPQGPLYRNVSGCAIAAASRDSRFKPIRLSELSDVEFEISVLSPIEIVTDFSTIEIGTHGLVVSKGNARGLLLPQVAIQHQWSREEFLGETCRKAGLPPTAWKQGATVHRFTAEVFP